MEDLDRLEEYKSPALPYCGTHKEQLELMHSISDVRLVLYPFVVEEVISGVWDETHQIGKREITAYLNGVLRDGAIQL